MNFLTFLTYNLIKSLKQRRFLRYVKDMLKARDVIFNRKDLLPFFMQIFTMMEFFYKSLVYRIKLSEAFYYDATWNGNKCPGEKHRKEKIN